MKRTLAELVRRSPSLAALAAIHLALVAAFVCALQIDATQVLGIPRWMKPAKFAMSIAIYLVTIAWLLPATGLTERTRRRLVGIIGGTMALEMLLITVQAARGTTSHFNIATTLDGAIFQTMGIAIGGWLVANNAHTIGAPDGGPGLPFVNWSTVAGDLRVAHFVGMHALQALPITGAWFGRRGVQSAAAVWAVVTAALAVQAALGRPLF